MFIKYWYIIHELYNTTKNVWFKWFFFKKCDCTETIYLYWTFFTLLPSGTMNITKRLKDFLNITNVIFMIWSQHQDTILKKNPKPNKKLKSHNVSYEYLCIYTANCAFILKCVERYSSTPIMHNTIVSNK